MGITEVVRGADLLLSTAAADFCFIAPLGLTPPAFYHCALMWTKKGNGWPSATNALSLRALREQGKTPENCAGF